MPTLAEAAAELEALQRLLEDGRDGASAEWLAAITEAIRLAEETVRAVASRGDAPDEDPRGR